MGMLDPRRRLAYTLDMLFGKGSSLALPLDRLEFTFSKRTGKVKHVMLDGRLICTFRSDGGVALTVEGARMLAKSDSFREHCIAVSNDAAKYIAEGRSVFCKHIAWHGSSIDVGSEVAVLDESGHVIAVGRAVVPSGLLKHLKEGVAVKVRGGDGTYR
ncbi:MAG: PUA domain-containing protein [Candidatus Nitrosocaldus sp.]|nr:PUA domain-containing protein [Candidatus Nitrosocaldus sp.]